MGGDRAADRRRGTIGLKVAGSFRWVDTDEAFESVVEALAGVDVVAIDTEFHRERTYFPKLALLQLGWTEPSGRAEVALVDPLAVSLDPLAKVLTGDAVTLMHAASQDIEVLGLACGAVPSTLFDTQVAAGFAGYSTPSLLTLVEGELGARLTKGDRLTDWLQRPLGEAQLQYAASDVLHLGALRDRLIDQLRELGRLDWALEECELARVRARAPRNPEEAWLKIKEARSLRGRAAGIAQSLAAWRERRAAAIDQPVRFVLGDLGLVGIAQRAPKTPAELKGIRGVDSRQLRGDIGKEVLAAVAAGLDHQAVRPPSDSVDLDRKLRPAVGLVSAWLSQLSRELRIDLSLLATRADIEALLADAPGARLREGWRAEVIGEPVRDLIGGRAALAFDGDRGLVLEPRDQRA